MKDEHVYILKKYIYILHKCTHAAMLRNAKGSVEEKNKMI